MERTYKGENLSGYRIGNSIHVYKYADNPNRWTMDIEMLNIKRLDLCELNSTEDAVKREIILIVHRELNKIKALMREINETEEIQ